MFKDRSGSTSSPAKEWRGHRSPRASCHSPFSPPSHPQPQLSRLCPPKAVVFPVKSVTFWNLHSGGCSCKKDGIFIRTLLPVRWLGVLFVLSCHIRTEMSVLNRVCCLPPGPPAPGSLVLCTLPSCCTISCNVEIPIFCLLRSRNQGSWMGRGETGAFLLQEMEKSTLLSEESWLG